MSDQRCPNCKLWNPSTAQICDCGYNFETLTVSAPIPGSSIRTADKASFGWLFWVQMIVVFVIIKLFGILGGLIAWGIWSLIAFLIKKYKAGQCQLFHPPSCGHSTGN